MFVDAWNNLLSIIPNQEGIFRIAAIVGAVVFFVALFSWLWKKRKGGGAGMAGFPWMATVIAAILVAPAVLIPLLLLIAQVFVFNICVPIGQAIINIF